MARVYLDRDNAFTLSLTQDGSPPVADAITSAALWVPGTAFADGNPRVYNATPQITLTDNATKVKVFLGDEAIQPGSYYCYLTIYDAINTDGIAWDTVTITALDWPAAV